MGAKLAPVRRALVVVAILALSLIGGIEPAGACSCVGFTDAEAFARADVVFRGEVIGRAEPTGMIRSSADPTTWTFRVHEVHKGTAIATQEVLSEWSGASCGLELPAAVGEVFVFATTEGSHLLPVRAGELYAGLCDGTRAAASGALALGEPSPPTPDPPEPTAWVPYAVLGVVVVGLGVLVALRTRTGEPT
jgi:hypothetical protein